MLQALGQNQVHKVAIIDDDEDWREQLCWLVEEGGYEPVTLAGPYGNDIDRLVDEAAQSADFVLCDYNLAARGLAQFKGAVVVERLFQRQKPTALITSFRAEATELIYKRQLIPKVIDRDEFSPENISTLFTACQMEFQNNPPAERRRHKAMIHVEEIIEKGANTAEVIAILPAWNLMRAVSFPLDLIDEPVRSAVEKGSWLIANVNIGAHEEEDLFYFGFQMAPEPDVEDGLT